LEFVGAGILENYLENWCTA